MNTSQKVLRLAPDLYIDNKDMLAVYNTQLDEITLFGEKSQRAFLNNFVKRTDKDGIKRWEKIFNILADEINDSLEYRQARVMNKLLQQPPYTKIFLEQMLENLFGADKYTLQILNNEYIIKIDIETNIDGLFEDTINNIKNIIPANMVLQVIQVEKYMHLYLNRNYTHGEMEALTYGELSQYAEENK